MGREKKFTGSSGEEIAQRFLIAGGYRILEKNFRTPFGELDIIAKKSGSMVFVEVKTRMTSSLGPPYLSMTRKKKRHIVKNAFCYLKMRGLVNSSWRVDLVSVKLNEDYEAEDIELFENVVEEGDH